MSIKLLAADLDGTLFNDDHQLSEQNILAIKKLIAKGIIFLPSSGRSLEQIPQELLEIDGINYLVSKNGAQVLDLKNKITIFERWLSVSQTGEILKLAMENKAYIMAYCNNAVYVINDVSAIENRSGFMVMREMLRMYMAVDDIYKLFLEKQFCADKIVLFFRDEVHEKVVMSKIKNPDSYEMSVTTENSVEITQKGVNKALGISALIKILGLTPEEIITVGDSGNDVEMLKMTQNSYAVSNAMDCAKNAAVHITVSNEENVIEALLEKLS